jgi:hypothetical protein
LETVAEQRADAVSFGDSEIVGDLEIVVDAFDADASEVLNPGYAPVLYQNQRVANIEITITNSGSDVYDISSEHDFLIAGNRGVYTVLDSRRCTVENNVLDPETAQLDPGEEQTFNACGFVSTVDIESLQLWISAPISSIAAAERYLTGRWFDLGGNESYDPDVTREQMEEALQLNADEAALDDPASPDDAVSAGDLIYELVDYSPDAASEFSEIRESEVSTNPGDVVILATFHITNTGDRLLAPDVLLIDESGTDALTYPVPVDLDNELGGMLPGGTMERTFMWTVDASSRSSLVLRLSHTGDEPGVSWMLPEGSNDFTWEPAEAEVASVASDDDRSPVPTGETASLGDFNLAVNTDSTAPGYVLNVTNASSGTDGNWIRATLESNDDVCEVTQATGTTTTISRFALPGAEFDTTFTCGDEADGILAVILADTGASEQVGYFELASLVAATPVDLATPFIPLDEATPAIFSPLASPVTEPPELVASPIAKPSTPNTDDSNTAATVLVAANVRSSPSLSSEIVTVAAEGEQVAITGNDVEADGYVWVPILTSNGTAGWIAEDFLER